MITDRNRMQFDIREMVLIDVPSQGCERGGVGLERNIQAFGYSFLKKRTDIPMLLPQSKITGDRCL